MAIRSSLAGLVVALCLASGPVWAQEPDPIVEAGQVAQAGLKAYDAGNYVEAVASFEKAETKFHAPTHLLFLGRAYTKLGKLAKARESYVKLTLEDVGPKAPKVFRDAKVDAIKELTTLEPRVPYVSIVVQGAAGENVRVTADGTVLPAADIGVPRPTDPGAHTYKATAQDMESATNTLEVKEGSRETVLLTLRSTASPLVEPTLPPPPPTAAEPARSGVSGLRVASYVSFGLGAVGLGVGTIMLVQRGSTQSSSDDQYQACAARGCTPAEQSSIDDLDAKAGTQGNIALGAFIVGGVAIVTGVTMLVVDHGKRSPTGRTTVQPWIGARSAGISGTF